MPLLPKLSELKDTDDRDICHLLSQMADKAIADPKNSPLPKVTLRKRAQTGSFTLYADDGHPGLRSDRWYSEPVMPSHWQLNDRYLIFFKMGLLVSKLLNKT